MIANEKLQVFDLTLTTSAPLFIGDGRTIPKKSYIYNQQQRKVSIFDENRFFALLLEKNLVDDYEQFMMGCDTNLDDFLKYTCKLTEQDWKPAVRYQMEAMDSLDPGHSLKDIHAFIRNAYGQAYVPGSSVKGALRTILLHQMIRQEQPHPDLDSSKNRSNMGKIPEKRYLNTLKQDQKHPENEVNSILRGVSVSDSLPVSDRDMMLAMKRDVHTDGSVGCINVCRESVRPGTEIRMKLTLDQSILQGKLTRESIMQAVKEFDQYYWDTYFQQFKPPAGEAEFPFQSSMILGGGSGFFAKSLVYPYLGEDRALSRTADYMKKNYPKAHRHDLDYELGIAPHTIKYTEFDGKMYPMGLCEVEIQ